MTEEEKEEPISRVISRLDKKISKGIPFNEEMCKTIEFLARNSQSEEVLQLIQRVVCKMRAKTRGGDELGKSEMKAQAFIRKSFYIDESGYVTRLNQASLKNLSC